MTTTNEVLPAVDETGDGFSRRKFLGLAAAVGGGAFLGSMAVVDRVLAQSEEAYTSFAIRHRRSTRSVNSATRSAASR
jgi:hypothetical protein